MDESLVRDRNATLPRNAWGSINNNLDSQSLLITEGNTSNSSSSNARQRVERENMDATQNIDSDAIYEEIDDPDEKRRTYSDYDKILNFNPAKVELLKSELNQKQRSQSHPALDELEYDTVWKMGDIDEKPPLPPKPKSRSISKPDARTQSLLDMPNAAQEYEYDVVTGIGATAQNTPSPKPKPRNLHKSASQPSIKIVRRSIQNKNRKLERNRFSRTENIPQELSSPKIKPRNISNENNPTRSAVSSSEQGQYDVVLRLGSYSENSPPPKYLRNSHSVPEDPLSSIEDNEYDIVLRTGGHAEEACNQLVLYEGDDNSDSDSFYDTMLGLRSQLENTMQEVVPYGGNSRP